MVFTILYLLVLLAELFFFVAFSIVTLSLIYSSIKGSPYVPTRSREVDEILKHVKLDRTLVFYELGSGDARISRFIAKKYQLKVVAVDVNPLLTLYARLLARFQKLSRIEFQTADIFSINLDKADVVYLFLMPDLIKRLRGKLEKELKKGTVIVSHGFKIEGFEKKLFYTLAHKPFPTYYYRL